MRRSRDGWRQHPRANVVVAIALLLLLDGVPLCQPFSGIGSVRRGTTTSHHRRVLPPCLPAAAAAAAAADGGETSLNDVVSGSNQLEDWKENTAGTDTLKRPSNVMGRRRVSSQQIGGDAEPTLPLPSPDPDEREIAGRRESLWRSEVVTTSAELLSSFEAALAARQTLMKKLLEEQTDCYRLYHGAVEGCPGLTIDRYGTVVLVQTFRDPPEDFGAGAVEDICRLASDSINAAEATTAASDGTYSTTEAVSFLPVWNDRRKRPRGRGGSGGEYREAPLPHRLNSGHEPLPEALGVKVGLENGVCYPLAARHRGIDPWLFLDLRAARRWVLNNSKGKEVLNLFSYTGGVAAAAACGGATSVWNIDFSATAHEVGRASLKLNAGLAGECECEWIKQDVLSTIRQLAGTPTKDYRQDRRGRNAKLAGGRHNRYDNRGSDGGGRRKRGGRGGGAASSGYGYGEGRSGPPAENRGKERGRGAVEKEKELKAKQFDLVFLDPPTWSKSKNGAVDLVRDYQTLFKPSLLATKDGGAVVATNHVSTVDCSEWVESLSRCAVKTGRAVRSVEVLLPEEDFPSPDGRHPLKIAIVRVVFPEATHSPMVSPPGFNQISLLHHPKEKYPHRPAVLE